MKRTVIIALMLVAVFAVSTVIHGCGKDKEDNFATIKGANS